ncbi:MAG: serine hydrolase [Myxococcales bacterium]|nr:serine hydrolase [Myxococcales bacterium]USN51809.1 MAG: serine hydrolase [Myxococcales bacterium]
MTTLRYQLEREINLAIDQNLATSISLSVICGNEKIVIHCGYSKKNNATSKASIYDLASLTKILGTTIAVAHAVATEKIALNERPFACWPLITIESLLNHTSGLKNHIKFYELAGISENNFSLNRQIIFDALFKQKPLYSVGEKHTYSDLNFLALGYLLEQRLKRPLFALFCDSWKSLGLKRLSWLPSESSTTSSFIAQTSTDNRARVHDDNCYYLGGIAGHAGIFATLDQVAFLGEYFLRCYKNPSDSIQECIKYFAQKHLGFFQSNSKGSTQALSPHAFGHFGFSGTSLWVDPQSHKKPGMSIALLTNRVFSSKEPSEIFNLRMKIHSLAARFMSDR